MGLNDVQEDKYSKKISSDQELIHSDPILIMMITFVIFNSASVMLAKDIYVPGSENILIRRCLYFFSTLELILI